MPRLPLPERAPRMSPPRPESPWYRDGLQFRCTRCGACCTGAPGFVWVNEEEIARLAEYRGETVEQFCRKFVPRGGPPLRPGGEAGGRLPFRGKEGRLPGLPGGAREIQTWPFWPENVESPESWE